jgi:RND family efflux transporter MFP subunit
MNHVIRIAICMFSVFAGAAPAFAQAPKGAPPPKVLVTPIIEKTVAAGQTFVGTVKPLRKSIVGSAVPGRVEEYLVNEGDRVKKSQPIAKLRTGIIQAELDAAAAELKVRQAELDELENGARPFELDQAKARLAIAEANRAFRQSTRNRTAGLGAAISREEMEENIALATQSEGAYEDAKATLALLEEGPRQEKIVQARAWVEMQTAQVQRLSDQLDRHTMYAPFNGFITAEHTEIGQWVMQGDPVAEIVELDQVDIEIPVLEDYVAQLYIGAEARVEIAALAGSQSGQKLFAGQVAILNQQADVRARTFPVKVRVANTLQDNSALIKAGMFARVTLAVGKPVQALMVPKDAVVLGGAPVVFVIDNAGGKQTARLVPVTLGVYDESYVQILGDLSAKMQVVVEGNERLRPGQEVRTETIVVPK